MPQPAGGGVGPRVLNVNVGMLGHVDSGKTSLVAALSTTLSTAALDKHPQSKERGITLDLGFSSFTMPMPDHLQGLPYDELQITLVDCPGHASLIRTIIGGVQIIDIMVLVVDVTKGLQTQTAECLVIGEIAAQRMVVALNKTDLLPEADRAKAIRKAQKRLQQTLAMTKFAGAPMVAVAASHSSSSSGAGAGAPQGVEELKAVLAAMAPQEVRNAEGPFLFSIDHCFQIKGQGTVLTGTVLQGTARVGQTIELPALKITRPIKSMQRFRQPVTSISAGDRAGLCVTQLDAGLVERGLAAGPGSVPTFSAAVACADKVRFYAGSVPSKARYHVCVGHATVMAEATFFGQPDAAGVSREGGLQLVIQNLSQMSLHQPLPAFDFDAEYLHQSELYGLEGRPLSGGRASTSGAAGDEGTHRHFGCQWVLLRFDKPVTAPEDALVIGARFDADQHGETCRLAFYGRLVALLGTGDSQQLKRLQVYKLKEKQGVLERVMPDGATAICRNLFKKDTDVSVFENARVTTPRGEVGTIEGRFGKSGKVKLRFEHMQWQSSSDKAAEGDEMGGNKRPHTSGDNQVLLQYKRFVFDPDKHRIRQ